MKIVAPGELEGHKQAVYVGGAKGFFGGLAAALPASYMAQRRWSYYRSLPLSIKALGVVSVVVPAFVIAAEQAGHQYEREQWKDIGKKELDAAQTAEEIRWHSLDTTGKISDWASRNKWGIILGSWGMSMVGSFGYIMRDRHQTFSQKIVQARMWAQGLTVGVVIASAVLSANTRAKSDPYHPHSTPDHSWSIAVRQAERERKARQTLE